MSATPIESTATATPKRAFLVVTVLLVLALLSWLSRWQGDGPSQPRLQTVVPIQRPQQEEQPAQPLHGAREEIQERITRRMMELQEQELDRLLNNSSDGYNNNNSSRIIVGGIANELNRSAVLNCGGQRIAMVGSSHARSMAFSFAGALTGHLYNNVADNIDIPSTDNSLMKSPASATNTTAQTLDIEMCTSWKSFTPRNATANKMDDPPDSCELPKYKPFFDQKRICRYTYDAGFNVGTCGYPSMKLWDLGRDQYYSRHASVPISHPLPESAVPQETNDSSTTRSVSMASLAQLLYMFKTWIYSPDVDRASIRHTQTYRPHVLVLDFSIWGCRSPDRLKAGRRDQDEKDNLTRNCTLDFQNAISNWDAGLENHKMPWLVIHYVNSQIGEYSAMNPMPAIQNLQRTSQRIHVVVDKATILRKMNYYWTSKLGHGYLGAATDIWARVALDTICTVNDATIS